MSGRPFRFRSPVYAILDPLGRTGVDLVSLGERMLAGGATILQLRWKDAPTGELVRVARELVGRAEARGAHLLVDDRADVAMAASAHGVHLGQDDIPVDDARRLLGAERIIGLSTHTLEQADAAAALDVDYLGFGPIFATETKATGYEPRGLAMLSAVRSRIALPVVAIGGIRLSSAPGVLAAGADAVAMISELAGATDPETAVRRAITALRSAAPKRSAGV